jgi:hypothetical protein
MPDQQSHTFEIPDFLAGVHNFSVYHKAPENSLFKAKNLVIDKAGYLKRRPGLNQLGDFGASANSYCSALIAAGNGSQRRLFAIHASALATFNVKAWNGSSWSAVTYGGLSGTLGLMLPHVPSWTREDSGTEYVYAGPGETSFIKIDVAALTASSVSLTGRSALGFNMALQYMDRLWAGGTNVAAYRDAVWYSDVLVPENIASSANDQNTIKFDGEFVTLIYPYRDNFIIVGTDRSLYILMVGTSANLLDWQKTKLANDIGVGSPFTAAYGNEDVYFLDQLKNVRTLKATVGQLGGGMAPVPISMPVKDSIRNLAGDSPSFINAAFLDGKYVISGHTGTLSGANGQSWCYDSYFGAWTGPFVWESASETSDLGTNILPSYACSKSFAGSWFTSSREYGMFFGARSGSTLKIFEWDESLYSDQTGTDGSSTVVIPTELITRAHDFGAPHQEKICKWVEIEYGDDDEGYSGSGAFTVYARKDFDSAWTSLGGVAYDSTTKFSRRKFPMKILDRGKIFQIRLTDNSATDGPKIRRMRINFQAFAVADN